MQTERHDAVRVIKKITLFLMPLVLFFGVSSAILAAAGEMFPVDRVIEAQKNENKLVLFGLAYINPDKYYKIRSVLERKPDVIALGSSRVMQFRSRFFKKNIKFFNAGGGVDSIKHFRHFLNMIPKGREPRVIIIGLDQYFFNHRYDKLADDDIDEKLSRRPTYLETCRAGCQVYADYFKKKFTLKGIFGRIGGGRIGLNAVINDNGFRNDGSYYYGKIVEHPDDPKIKQRFDDVFGRLSGGTNRFEYNRDFSPDAVNELREFLKECRMRNIYVVGFLPPFPHVVYEKMEAMGDKYEYMFKLEPVFRNIFMEYGFGFFDFSDLMALGAADDEAIDGFHGSEKAYLRLFIVMAERDSVMRRYSEDLQYLRKRLYDSTGPYDVFSNSEF